MNINIRVANENDSVTIDKITNESWNKTYNKILSKEFLDNLYNNSERSIQIIKNHINQFYIIENDNKILGFARIKELDTSTGIINSLYIDVNETQKGYGTQLLKYIFNRLNYKKYMIQVFDENSANEFYKKIGSKLVKSEITEMDNKKHKINTYEYKI